MIHDWSLPEGRSPDNLRDVKMCNPLKVITPAAPRKYEDPSIKAAPAHWRRFACNQSAFLEGEEPPITPEEWDAARVDIGAMVDGEKVHVVVRVGQAGGCSIGIAAARDGGVAVRLEVYPYSSPGLKKALHRLVDRYQVEKIYIDPASTAWEPTSWRRRGCRWRIGRRRRCHHGNDRDVPRAAIGREGVPRRRRGAARAGDLGTDEGVGHGRIFRTFG